MNPPSAEGGSRARAPIDNIRSAVAALAIALSAGGCSPNDAAQDGARSKTPVFREQLPPAVKLEIVYDRSESMHESVRDVQFTLLLTLALVQASE